MSLRILYVEDNYANLALVERVAGMGNHTVINYTTAEDALANYAHDDPDIALVDIYLEGELDGIDFIEAVRNDGYNTPMIVITAYDSALQQERCMQTGADDYFPKPIPVNELKDIIDGYAQAF